MIFKPISRFVLYFSLWLIPAFALWGIALDSVILPSLHSVVAATTASSFKKEQAKLNVSPNNAHEWVVNTHLLTKEQPQNSNRRRTLNMNITLIVTHTLGFPILWAWFLATPHRRIFNQVVGNIILFILVTGVLWLKVFLTIAKVMASGETEQVMILPHLYQPITAYPDWLIAVLSPIQSVLAYMAVGLIVPILWYGLNRQFVMDLLSGNSQQEEKIDKAVNSDNPQEEKS